MTRSATIEVPGYPTPRWATGYTMESGIIDWSLESDTKVSTMTGPDADEERLRTVALVRQDTLELVDDRLIVTVGQALVGIGGDSFVTPSEARSLASALLELVNRYDEVTEATS
jgi:hypothetical protein